MMMRSLPIRLLKAATCVSMLLAGCGGGTSGTGLNSYEGRVLDQNGMPVEGVRLTLESTGDTTRSDAQGDFLLQSDASGEQVYLLAEKGEFNDRLQVNNVFDGDSRVRINVTIDSVLKRASTTDFNMRARMVGLCDYYFENRSYIRQANRVPPGTTCTLKVELLGDGVALDGVKVALEYSSCEEGARWKPYRVSRTGIEEGKGVAKLKFNFRSSPEFCRYRVVGPYNFGSAWPVYYPIETFQENELAQTPSHTVK